MKIIEGCLSQRVSLPINSLARFINVSRIHKFSRTKKVSSLKHSCSFDTSLSINIKEILTKQMNKQWQVELDTWQISFYPNSETCFLFHEADGNWNVRTQHRNKWSLVAWWIEIDANKPNLPRKIRRKLVTKNSRPKGPTCDACLIKRKVLRSDDCHRWLC